MQQIIKANLCEEEFESLQKGKTIDLVMLNETIMVKLSFDKNKDINGEKI